MIGPVLTSRCCGPIRLAPIQRSRRLSPHLLQRDPICWRSDLAAQLGVEGRQHRGDIAEPKSEPARRVCQVDALAHELLPV